MSTSDVRPREWLRANESATLTLAAAGRAFVDDLVASLDGRQATVAVLPMAEAGGHLTACSGYLADRLASSFLSTPLQVVDRQSLKATLREVDLGAVFQNTQFVPSLVAADVLVVGQYVLAAGLLELNLKAVQVRTNALILAQTYRVRTDPRIRQLVFAGSRRQTDGHSASLIELEQGFRIRAGYAQEGAGQLRLLDRVRQAIRRRLTSYLRDGLGCVLSDEEIEGIYHQGVETACEFGTHSIELEMEFGDPSCLAR